MEFDFKEKLEYSLTLVTLSFWNPFHSFPSSHVLQNHHSLEDNTKSSNLEKVL